MKRFSMASVTLAVLVLPTVALASVPTLHHKAIYSSLYRADQRMHGQRDPGCKLVGPGKTCHVRTTDALVVRSIGVLQRAIAPPPPPVVATAGAEATNVGTYTPQARTVSARSYAPTRSQFYTSRRTYTAPVQHYSAPSSYSGGYSIPSSIVQCESGGNWHAVNPSSGAGGAYQILPSTWSAYGGTGSPQNASPAEQSAIAAKIYAGGAGRSQWSC